MNGSNALWLNQITNSGIHNLSNYPLSTKQLTALSLGFNFIPVPKPLPNLKEHIDAQYADFVKHVRTTSVFIHTDDNNNNKFLRPTFKTTIWEPPKVPNPAVEEYLSEVESRLQNELKRLDSHPAKHFTTRQYSPPWFHKILLEIKENKEILVTEADKNMGTVVIKTSEYIKHGLGQLNDRNTYITCDSPPNYNHIWTVLKAILSKYNQLTYRPQNKNQDVLTTISKFLLQLEGRDELKLGSFYMLMKVHKTPLAGRPIVSSINTITYFASKYIDYKLQPIYKRIPSYVGSSQDLLLILESLKFTNNKDCFILCADVDSLYPNIPKVKGLAMMRESIFLRNQLLPENRLTVNDINLICDLMEFVLDNNYFTFGDLIFKQVNGTAMGTPAAVVFACLFLDNHEHNVMTSTNVQPLLYRRFIDDIFAVFKCKQDAELFIQTFSSDVNLPTIKCSNFTISDKEGIFLDLHIFKGKRFTERNLMDIKIYQKPQNKYLYIPLNSFHPKSVFPSYIKAELNRYRFTCTGDEDFLTVKDDFFKRLTARGYPNDFLTPIFADIQPRQNLINKAKQRLYSTNSNIKSKNTIIFKTRYSPQIKALKLKDCLQLTEGMKMTQDGINLCHGRDPIICYSNPPAIRSYFSQSRKNLHALPLTHNISLNIEDIDNLIGRHKHRPDSQDNSRETLPFRVRVNPNVSTDLSQRL